MGALQIKRGPSANLPAKAALGEPLIATDTRELWVGQGTGGSDGPLYKIGDIIYATSAPAFSAGKVWINPTTNKIYRANDATTPWTEIGGGGGGGSSTVSADITVYGVTQGSYSNGNVITLGTPLEDVIKNMLQTIIPPTYAAPTLSLAGSGTLTVEAGTTITPTLTPTFTQRDGGSALTYTLKKDGATIYTNATASAQADTGFIIGDTAVNYQATDTYNQGPIKNDNQGNASPTGQIAAGTATSNTVTYSGKRYLFYTADTGVTAPADSAAVRFLTTKVLNPANGSAFTLNIPAGTARVVFAYPATLRDVTSVKYVELGNGEVKDTFTLTTFNVEGAAAFTAIGYKIYSYVPAMPYGDAVTYQVVI